MQIDAYVINSGMLTLPKKSFQGTEHVQAHAYFLPLPIKDQSVQFYFTTADFPYGNTKQMWKSHI